MRLRVISIAAIVIGLAMEIFLIGSEYSLGTVIAGAGIFGFVYDFFKRRQGPRF